MPSKFQNISLPANLHQQASCYQKMPIHPRLAPYVKSIELDLLHSDIQQAALPYRVLPDFSVVMGFQYRGSLYLLEKGNKQQLSHCGISGLQTQHKLFQAENLATKTILVKFYPWAINALFKEAAYHFTNQALGLADVVKPGLISCLEEQLMATTKPYELSQLVQDFLIQLLSTRDNESPSKCMIALSQQIIHSPALPTVNELAKQFGLSKRTLERQFKVILGMSPKTYLKLGQFQKTLQQLRTGSCWEAIVDQLNYYDQAHFINSFKQFSGLTPSQFIQFLGNEAIKTIALPNA
jgi:AraC-like DNA-binding protein